MPQTPINLSKLTNSKDPYVIQFFKEIDRYGWLMIYEKWKTDPRPTSEAACLDGYVLEETLVKIFQARWANGPKLNKTGPCVDELRKAASRDYGKRIIKWWDGEHVAFEYFVKASIDTPADLCPKTPEAQYPYVHFIEDIGRYGWLEVSKPWRQAAPEGTVRVATYPDNTVSHAVVRAVYDYYLQQRNHGPPSKEHVGRLNFMLKDRFVLRTRVKDGKPVKVYVELPLEPLAL